MKKNLFITLLMFVFALPSWADYEISGSSSPCGGEKYFVPGASNVSWSYTTSIVEYHNIPAITLTSLPNDTVQIKRGASYSANFAPLDTNQYEYYTGTVTLIANVNGSPYTKVLTLSPVERPLLSAIAVSPMIVNQSRTFTITNCSSVSNSNLMWQVRMPQTSTITTYYGRSLTLSSSIIGTLNIKLYNLENACSNLYSEYTVSVRPPLPPLSFFFQNPVESGNVDIQVIDQDFENSRSAIDYTLELWNENSRAIKSVNSTINGEKDVVTMDVNGLPNGIYFISLKVNNEIITTSKLIINK